MVRLSPALITSFAGGTYPIPDIPNGPFVLPFCPTIYAVVHIHEVTIVVMVTSLSVGFVTVNSFATLPFFIEIEPKSYDISDIERTLSGIFIEVDVDSEIAWTVVIVPFFPEYPHTKRPAKITRIIAIILIFDFIVTRSN